MVAGTVSLDAGYRPDLDGLRGNWHRAGQWLPGMDPEYRQEQYANWRRAVERAVDWIQR